MPLEALVRNRETATSCALRTTKEQAEKELESLREMVDDLEGYPVSCPRYKELAATMLWACAKLRYLHEEAARLQEELEKLRKPKEER